MSEMKQCQSCQQPFSIYPGDIAFYQTMQVPAPTWCPSCRLQRRLVFLNERRVFNRPDARTGQLVFSNFSPAALVKVYHNDFWYSDGWDPTSFGRPYDFTRPFFTQLRELLGDVPLLARSTNDTENSEYCIMAGYLRNCYLVSYADYTQDSAYVVYDARSRNCFDTLQTNECELCYQSINLDRCYQTFYSVDCENSRNLWFCRDLVGCSNCFGCTNLRNKQYCVWNEQLTREQYEAKLKEFGLGHQRRSSNWRSKPTHSGSKPHASSCRVQITSR